MHLVYSDTMDFKWATIVLIRAFAHSNGWVRLWALEKLVAIQPGTMAASYDYFLTVISNQLNSNEPFWRLVYRGSLSAFLDSLRSQIVGILSLLDNSDRETFLRRIFLTITEMSSPSSMFFISHSSMEIPTFPCLHMDDISLVIMLLQKARHIQNTTLRLATLFNFVVFFSKIVKSSREVANKIGYMTAFFSREDQSLFNRFVNMKSSQVILQSAFEPLDVVQFALQNRVDFEKDDFAALLWIRANLTGKKDEMKAVIEKVLADRLAEETNGSIEELSCSVIEAVDTLLTILFAYKEELLPVFYGLAELIQRYILFRCTTASSSKPQPSRVHSVYVGIWKRLELSLKSIVDLCLSLISEEKEITVERHCFLLQISYDAFAHLSHDELDDVIPCLVRYLGENPLLPLEHSKSVVIPRDKDANKLSAVIHEYRLKFVIKLLPNVLRMDPKQILMDCADQLAYASSYPVAQCYLDILQMLIDEVPCSTTLLAVVKAAIVFTKEQKKSHHFLPTLRSLLRLCFSKSVMNEQSVASVFMEYAFDLLTVAQLNTSVALYLSEALSKAENANLLSRNGRLWFFLSLSLDQYQERKIKFSMQLMR
ncbi:hypothetical protein KIN20_009413 [Parelaphostrongylus tenuis]|uniref:Uncharacterized protein n=1 Tax=Parelaphostrongylus tenuis TaxID=148309 RepID=A0AAD5MP19_PARTN|nr:hypothetical protein KIN20_009413 [Parelaphostrongylus tenuis]